MNKAEIGLASARTNQIRQRRQELVDQESFDKNEAAWVIWAEMLFGRTEHWPMKAVIEGLNVIVDGGVRKNLERSGGSKHIDVDVK